MLWQSDTCHHGMHPLIVRIQLLYIKILKKKKKKNFYILNFESWVLVSLTSKFSDGWIRNLRFNPCLYQKSIGVFV